MTIEHLHKRLANKGYFNWRIEKQHPEFSPTYWLLMCLEHDNRRVFQIYYGEDWDIAFQYAQDCHRAGQIETTVEHILRER